MKIAVTGATGFVGQTLCPYLEQTLGAGILPLHRNNSKGNLALSNSDAALASALTGIDCLVHLAARAHTKNATAADFERDNQHLCRRIADIALAVKIPRVIYLSSIKVNGESTKNRPPFCAEDVPAPEDDYGRSKLACERILQDTFKNSSTQLVIIRPPLVYSNTNKGNLGALQRMIQLGIPLPFASIQNKRDLVSLQNLCSLIALCCTHPQAANHIFLVSDGVCRSTADIVRLLAQRAQLNAHLFSLPSAFFSLASCVKPGAIARLTGDLQADISKTQHILGWSPEQL